MKPATFRMAACAAALLWGHSIRALEPQDQLSATAVAPADPAAAPSSAQSESEHVAPNPPSQVMPDMTYKSMAQMMQMTDRETFGAVLIDQLEWGDASGAGAFDWYAQGWYGGDYDKLWLKTEGEHAEGTTWDARVEALWDHVFARWWSLQTGLRHDFGDGPSRNWAAFGVAGLAPYFFNLEATAYVGDAGRTAARIRAEYEVLFSQRLILQPEFEVNAYGQDDPERQIGAGISDFQLGLRLRYEFRREIAPYLGVVWVRRTGRTADFARAAGESTGDVWAVLGVRIFFSAP
jgi:copper resistance protein B